MDHIDATIFKTLNEHDHRITDHDGCISLLAKWVTNQNKLNRLLGVEALILTLGLYLANKRYQQKYDELRAEIEELKHAKEE